MTTAILTPDRLEQLRQFEKQLQLPPNHAPITPVSSPEDKREYRVITLSNGLTALLISDPTTDKAAASLDVNIGSFAEPTKTLGLAHFLEHMLFMGTTKYPDENSYSLAINNYGGSQNAYTTREHTNYIFDVTKDHLEEVLDRFAQFFVAPLCLKSAVDRELNAVNNEHEKNLQSDYWRIDQLSESSLNPAHPISRFSTGNFLTLRDEPKAAGLDIREELLSFYYSHYSANLMKLCVLGQEKLDDLERYVKASFSDVKNISKPRPDYTTIPLAIPRVHTTTITKIVPVKQYRMMEVEWIFPPIHQDYLSEPSQLIVHNLATESEGSLAKYLKDESLVNSLHANSFEQNSSYSLAKIEMELTEKGLVEYERILESIFQYVRMLYDTLNSPTESARWKNEIYAETQAVEKMEFRFAEKQDAINFCETQAARLSSLPAQHVLSGGLLAEYNEPLLKEYLTNLINVESTRVRLIAPEYKSLPNLKQETWYKTEHTIEHYSADLIARLSAPTKAPHFHLPKMNPYLATDFELKFKQRTVEEKKAGLMNDPPKKLCGCRNQDATAATSSSATPSTSTTSPSSVELYFVPDHSFELPKANITIQISNNSVALSPRTKSLAHLWSDLVDDALSELNHYASESGLDSYSWPTNAGLMLRYNGYNHKIRAFIEDLLPVLRGVKATEMTDQFARLKEQYSRRLNQYAKETPLTHARDDAQQLRLDTYHTVQEQLQSFDSITPADVDAFVESWFRSGQIYMLVNGNITEAEVNELTTSIQKVFPLQPLLSSQQYINRCIDLPATHSYVRQIPSKNADDTNSCCLNIYQIGVADESMDAHMSLVSHILADASFDQLRTKETLGYLVQGYHSKTSGVLHYHLAVQSSDASAAYLNCRIEAFIKWFRDVQLAALISETPDFIEKNKQAVILQLTEKDRNLGDEHSRLWTEIDRRRFDWKRYQRVAKEVEKITLDSLLAFYDKYLLGDGATSERKKLSFQIFSAAHPLPARQPRETQESVEFGNKKLVLKAVAPSAGATTTTGDEKKEETTSDGTASTATSEVYLPPVPVDRRPIKYIDDIVEFKRQHRMYPAML